MSEASSSAQGTLVPQATTAPAAAQSQPQYSNQSQATDQSTQTAATSAAQAAAAAAAAVAAVGNQNGTNNAASEDFVCMWQGCSERSTSAEALYEHVCERHVGRKSTNNLNLTCQWGNCRTTTVKRDHITSHIRVHVPLKPHKCELCGKAFKRPQDLKKHVKTHADDSVLIRSPEPGRNQEVPFGGMVNNTKAGFSGGAHYFDPAMNPVHAGQNYHHPPPYYQGQSHQHPANPAYGNVFYTLNQGDSHPSFDSRKRTFDSVNDFFGDAKRRQFDITSYAAIGQRLGGLQGLQLPVSTGSAPEYHGMHGPVGVSGGGYGPALATPAYHLPPMSNARTKHDLVDLDHMLDTIHTTVYENDDHVAAAGIAQPGATYIPHRMVGYGTAQQLSPTQVPSSHVTAAGSHAAMTATSAHSPGSGTPALTPPSSAHSYTSSRSPGSFSHRVSPPQHDVPMYPRLPSTTGHESMASAYPTTTGAAPPSTLSGNYDYEDARRRYTGGSLMRSRPDDYRSGSTFSGSDDRERTPTADKERPKESTGSPEQFSSSLIDPALQSTSSPDVEAAQRTAQAATDAAKRAEEEWLENVRILEQLRAYIKDRLARGDYEDEAGKYTERTSPSSTQPDHMEGVEKTSLVPDASVESSEEKPQTSQDSLYPTLKVIEDDGDSKME